ncbi:hypothetical protein THAOC_22163 [Thalassiosira oceanica]|uniref:Uncharacterized protein n=1 Tax=Thalassiosira oceanica TaxID=159749 RepID=K0SA19_THAOC|nr:hypothetical protein THAOC_22163 [Thalassiosira oceanica]|eukprot:EJK57766.1 hypothetical protein THAOC_22163 [Thalassiosira oceanica]
MLPKLTTVDSFFELRHFIAAVTAENHNPSPTWQVSSEIANMPRLTPKRKDLSDLSPRDAVEAYAERKETKQRVRSGKRRLKKRSSVRELTSKEQLFPRDHQLGRSQHYTLRYHTLLMVIFRSKGDKVA